MQQEAKGFDAYLVNSIEFILLQFVSTIRFFNCVKCSSDNLITFPVMSNYLHTVDQRKSITFHVILQSFSGLIFLTTKLFMRKLINDLLYQTCPLILCRMILYIFEELISPSDQRKRIFVRQFSCEKRICNTLCQASFREQLITNSQEEQLENRDTV